MSDHGNGHDGNGNLNGNGHRPRQTMRLGLKQVVHFDDTPSSTVIEVDHVTLHAPDGSLKHQWDTFILRARDKDNADAQFNIWRIANIPDMGVHFCFATDPKPANDIDPYLREDLSGDIKIQREGIHPTRFFRGNMQVYALPNGIIYVVKSTDDIVGTQHFECRPRYDVHG
jgi:hypothetical protein